MNQSMQKSIGRDLLSKLKILDPQVVIAGGAPRDWYLGKDATDIDFYLSHPNLSVLGNKKIISRVLNIEEDLIEIMGFADPEDPKDPDFEYQCSYIQAVYELVYKGIKVQIINTYEKINVMDFSFSICQAWTSDCIEINGTADFFNSIKHKMVFRTGSMLNNETYTKKMMDKFPDFLFLEEKPKQINLGTKAPKLRIL